jgi:hypothetical protein
VYAVSRNGRAWELNTRWRAPSAEPGDLALGGSPPIPIVSGAAAGYVDGASLEPVVVTAFGVPRTVQLEDVSGLEFDADSSEKEIIGVSDRSALSPDPVEAASGSDPQSVSFHVPPNTSGTYRLMMDNCPQWYALRGHSLYLRHGVGLRVRRVRLLLRAGARVK